MLYDKYCELCKLRDVAPTTAALEAGISKSTITKWKNNPETTITSNILNKLSAYFGISPYDLMAIFDGSKEVPKVENEKLGELKKDEIELIELLRELPDDKKDTALEVIRAMAVASKAL